MNKPIISCHNVSKVFKDAGSSIQILNQINLSIYPGEMIAIVGISGSGKSTLMHLLGGLDHPSSGQVYLKEQDIHTLSEIERCRIRNTHLGFVYQFHHLLPEFSALENVSMPMLIGGKSPYHANEKASYLLEQVGLAHRFTHRPGQLSGGERQRVAIARALIMDPICILADEPTGNLDPENAERVLDLFFKLQESLKTSVLMVTHDPSIAKRSKRTLRIEAGQLVELVS